MKWYGILAIVFIFWVFVGIVYMGVNGITVEFNFGEPSYISKVIIVEDQFSNGETNSYCGTGTIYDPDTNSCVLTDKPNESNSKCGSGTIYQWETHSCILSPPPEPTESLLPNQQKV